MNRKLLGNGLMAAALMNISGVLIFSRAFTNTTINSADPVVMSNFGLLMIVVWGLAYLAVVPLASGLTPASISTNYRWIFAAFAVEKLVYGVVWIAWHLENSLTALYAKDVFAGVFYSIYGLNDLMFMVFFASAFFWPPKD